METFMKATNSKSKIANSIIFSIVLNGLIPMVIYSLMKQHFPELTSLITATCVPLLYNLYSLLKVKKLDAFAMFMLIGFTLGILALFLGGDERIILLRESFVTGIMGILFLATLLLPKPIIYYFAIKFTAEGNPERKLIFENGWKYSYFRFAFRIMTTVWGLASICEAAIKTYLVFHLSIIAFMAASQFVFYGIIGPTIIWTIWYSKHMKKNMRRIKEQAEIKV